MHKPIPAEDERMGAIVVDAARFDLLIEDRGFLINFNERLLKEGLQRIVH
jgi:hypothetical protein